MRRVLAITVPIIIFMLVVGALAGLAMMGAVIFTPQDPTYITQGWANNQPAPGPGPNYSVQYPPVYAILHFYPNGSATAQAWIYDPNTVPVKVISFGISPVFTSNNTPVWWGLDSTPTNSSYPPGAWGEVLPFTFAYTNDWTLVYTNTSYPSGTLIPPGLLVDNGSGEYFAVYVLASSPLGSFNFYEPFMYVGNNTWVATPWTGYLLHGVFTYWQVWPEEVPPGWAYPNLVNITNAPLPPWWGKSGIGPWSLHSL